MGTSVQAIVASPRASEEMSSAQSSFGVQLPILSAPHSTAENATRSPETALLSKEQDRQIDSPQVSSPEINISHLFESGESNLDIDLPSLFELGHPEIDFQSLFQPREPSDQS
jgi:hypothetical protein